jgi:hypothetical protein
MEDFGPEANCPEPWNVDVAVEPIGDGLTDAGGSAKLVIDVYDRGGKTTHGSPVVECPEIFDGSMTASWQEDIAGGSRWGVTVENQKLADAGRYRCLVGVEDNENATSPEWLDLTAYQIVKLLVSQAQPDHHELWYYHSVNLLPDQNLAGAIDLVQEAAGYGYEKVVLADFKLGTIDIQSQTYWDHLASYCDAAKDAGIEVIPSLVPIGYSDAVLCHDPNLIEGQPVKDCVFQVSGDTGSVWQDPSIEILNGDFEDYTGDQFDHWNQMDGAGVATFVDTSVKHSGGASIRYENFTSNPNGNDRIRQDIGVKPWNCYAISFWMKTDNCVPSGSIRFQVFSPDIQDTLHFLSLRINKTQDWQHYYIIFNSQDYETVALYIGIWGGESGRFWLDDVTIENAGLINLIRRDGCPLTVTNEAGTAIYTEGIDFEYVSDPLMGHAGGLVKSGVNIMQR